MESNQSNLTTQNPNKKSIGKNKTAYRNEQNNFRGATPGMQGHVFQVHSEQRKSGQFDDTMNALKTFASNKYVQHIDYLTPIFVDLSEPQLVKPTLKSTKEELTLKDGTKREIETASEEDKIEYTIKMKRYLKEVKELKQVMRSLYNVITGQCSKLMLSKLKGKPDMAEIEKQGNVVQLLVEIREISRMMSANASVYDCLDEAKRIFYTYSQQPEDSNEQHLKSFKSNSDVVEHYGGVLYADKALIDYEKGLDKANGVATRTDEEY